MKIHITLITEQMSRQQELLIFFVKIHNFLQKIQQPYSNEYHEKFGMIEKTADLFEKIHIFFLKIQQPYSNEYHKKLEIQNGNE